MKQVQEYWPPILQEIKEFQEIAKAENPELEKVWQEVDNLIDDQFIETATERGIARRERILGIATFADDDLETRRFRIYARWNDKLPYTYRVLENKLIQLCGEDGYLMNLNVDAYSLEIRVELIRKRMLDEVALLAKLMVPANILLTVDLRYNQHSRLARYTHGDLRNYTQDQLRNEVLS